MTSDLHTFMSALDSWHWLSFSIILILIELSFLGTYFLLCSGVAALGVAVMLFLVPALSWQAQLSLWGGISLILIIGWSLYRKAHPNGANTTDEPFLNQRGAQYIGRILTLDKDIDAKQSVQIKVDDTYWSVQAMTPFAAGDRVRVVRVQSTILHVEAAEE